MLSLSRRRRRTAEGELAIVRPFRLILLVLFISQTSDLTVVRYHYAGLGISPNLTSSCGTVRLSLPKTNGDLEHVWVPDTSTSCLHTGSDFQLPPFFNGHKTVRMRGSVDGERQDAFTLDVLEVPQGSGSGFVWDKKGHIVTNYHVIRGASDLRLVKFFLFTPSCPVDPESKLYYMELRNC
ncbi:protease Do-like protein 1, chloroplastic [Tanacetum coccineum]